MPLMTDIPGIQHFNIHPVHQYSCRRRFGPGWPCRIASAGAWVFLLFCMMSPVDARVTAQLDLGFEQTYLAGSWAPVRVEISSRPVPGSRNRPFEGLASVTIKDYGGNKLSYTRPLKLPLNSRKRIEFITWLPSSFRLIKFELIEEDGDIFFRKAEQY
jgi:hypothetical protein